MSVVTNVILHMGYLDETYLAQVNEFFDKEDRDGRKGFVLVDDPTLPRGWYGGTKMLECTLAIGAFNYLDLDDLVEHLRKIKWPRYTQGNVQLMVKEQDHGRFRIIDVA
jgi:hypothetical protein